MQKANVVYLDKVAANRFPQHYRNAAPTDAEAKLISNAIAIASKIRNGDGSSTPLFTLGHLADQTRVNVGLLRKFVARRDEFAYRSFLLKKNGGNRGFRTISVPRIELKLVQRWISDQILSHQLKHSASTAYSPGSKLVDAVKPHVECRWLIKIDITAFFDSISERRVYEVFLKIGYQPLVAFELTRLCTQLSRETPWRSQHRWRNEKSLKYDVIGTYRNMRVGHLPQGAPTSPMLSNLIMWSFDEEMTALAKAQGFTYTRYADDIALSTRLQSSRIACEALIASVYKLIGRFGFAPNLSKTKLASPNARKIVLGLLVDGPIPQLPKDFRKELRQHIHYIKRFGANEHAIRRDFKSVSGMRNYLLGIAYFARQIDPAYGSAAIEELKSIHWPI
ncbi:RT_Bac_retron_II domain containing protein [Comamonadaceae bacterium]